MRASRSSPPVAAPAEPSGLRGWALLAVPLCLALAAYARVLHGEFQFDDVRSVVENPAVKDLGAFLRERLPAGLAGSPRPVTDLTFALDYAVARLSPVPFHATNLAIHAAVVALLCAFTRRVLRDAGHARPWPIALAVAGTFAVHPLQSQAVSYVTQRAESLASLLYVATLLLLLAAERRGRTAAGAALYAAGLGALALGLGAKPIAATAPAALLLLALAGPAGEPLRAALARRAAVAAAPLALALEFTRRSLAATEGSGDAGFSLPGLGPWPYLLTQLRAVVRYARLLVWPAGQSLDVDLPVARGLSDPATLACGLLLAGVALAAAALLWRGRRGEGDPGARARVAGVGLSWFFLVLAPSSSVIPLVDLVAEHRAYLASWGLLVAAALLAEGFVERGGERARRWAAAGVVALWAALALALHARNAVWETKRALWADVVAKSPRLARGYVNLGHALSLEGDQAGAIALYREALARAPGDPHVEAFEIERNLAAALIQAGRLGEARAALEEALRGRRDPDLLNNLAILRLEQGDPAGAAGAAREAIARDPARPRAYSTLGEALLAQGDAPGALASFEEAVRLDPDVALRHHNLAVAQSRLGRRAEACASLARYLELERDEAERADARRWAAELGCR